MPAISAITIAALAVQAFGQGTPEALAAFHKGQYAQARRMLEKIVEAKPSDEVARTFLALSRAGMGSCDVATPELRRQFTGNADATLRRLSGVALVQCDLAASRIEQAWPVLEQLRKSFPGDADVLYETAKVHMRGWNEAVYQMYQKAPSSFRVNQLSGEIFETQGRYQDAAAEYRKAIAKNPAALNLHYRLGRALLLQSHDPANLRAAGQEFEAELALNPDDAVAEYQLGQILLAEQKAAGAGARFEKALSLRPDFGEALVALARLKTEAKEYAAAVPLLERAVKLQPSSESAHYSLMLAYRNSGRTLDAQREKAVLDKLKKPQEGEFTDFLKRLGEKAPQP